jgi:hypothetical protein
MRDPRLRGRHQRRSGRYQALIVLSLFNGLSAVGGGIGMIVADGLFDA